MARLVAIIPFFGGTSSATHSLEETRLGYLEETGNSIQAELGVVPTVFQSRKDRVDVPGSIRLDVDPIWLPYAACVYLQQNHEGAYGARPDLVYYTEADQVVHVHDDGIFEIPNDEQYLAPWRLDVVGPNGECEQPNGARMKVDGTLYSISNGGHRIEREGDKWGTIDFHSQQQAFSGAWLATRDYFLRIPFRKMHVLPVEHASGFDAKSIGDCLKTTWVERFWVDHLSPRDRWQEPAQESATT